MNSIAHVEFVTTAFDSSDGVKSLRQERQPSEWYLTSVDLTGVVA